MEHCLFMLKLATSPTFYVSDTGISRKAKSNTTPGSFNAYYDMNELSTSNFKNIIFKNYLISYVIINDNIADFCQ